MSNSLKLITLEGELSKTILNSFCGKNAIVAVEYLSSSGGGAIPPLLLLEECVRKGTTRDILSRYEHYFLVSLLRMTQNDLMLKVPDIDGENDYYIRSMSDVIAWRGRAFRIAADICDVYWTDPGFHEVFMQRLSEFTSELRRVEAVLSKYVISIDADIDARDFIYMTTHPMSLKLTTKFGVSLCANTDNVDANIMTLYSNATRLLENSDAIRKFIIEWLMGCHGKNRLFEPQLIRTICSFLMQKVS